MDSADHSRPPGVAHGFQVSADPVAASASESRDVLNTDERRSAIADNSGEFEPKARSGAGEAGSCAGDANVLAGEAPAGNVRANSPCGEAGGGDASDIDKAGNLRPMARQDAARICVALDEGRRLERPGDLEAERKSPNAGEKVQDLQHVSRPP